MDRLKLDFEALFNASPNPYLVLDRKLHIVGANRAYLQSTKRELADIVGRWAWDAFPTDPETLRQSIDSFERVLRTGKPDIMALLRFDVPRPDSEGGGFEERYWSIIHSPVFDAAGDVALVLQHPIDVTELQRLRDAVQDRRDTNVPNLAPAHSGIFGRAQAVHQVNQLLLAETEQLRALFEQAPGFMALLRGPEHVFELANEAYCDIVGRSELLGKPLREALPEMADQAFPALLDEVWRTGRPYHGRDMRVLLKRTANGAPEERYVDFVYQPLVNADGEV